MLLLFIFQFNSINFAAIPQTPQKVKMDSLGGENTWHFEEQVIEKLSDDKAFQYQEISNAPSWWTSFKNWLKNIIIDFLEWLFGDLELNGFWIFVIEAIPYLIIILIIVFLVWLFAKLYPETLNFKNKETPQVFFTEEEEIIKSKNISDLISKAINNKDYRLAIRYYFLHILKNLEEAQIINYEFNKTNTDYFKEISQENLKPNFKKLSLLYDYVWYGNFEVNEIDFVKAERNFQTFEKQIKP